MQLYKERLLSQDRHRDYVRAVERNRLVRQVRQRPRRSLRPTGRALAHVIGLFFSI